MTDRMRIPESGRLPDAPKDNWVDALIAPKLRPFLRLSRFDRPIGTWLLLIPCWWGLMLAIASEPPSLGWDDARIFAAFAVGAVLMRGSGCTWNDLADRKLDREVARTRSRPLASGTISVPLAVAWMILQALLAFLVLLSFNANTIMLGILALVPAVLYPFAKRFTWWPQLFLGFAFNWGVLLGWTAHNGHLGLAPVVLYVCGIAWTLFYDTIYALQDLKDDELAGIKSTARLFGKEAKSWLLIFAGSAGALMVLAIYLAMPIAHHGSASFVAIGGAVMFLGHLLMQLRVLDRSDPESCMKVFRSNRNAGLIPVLVLAFAAAA